jgi:uncharacterized protein YqeY
MLEPQIAQDLKAALLAGDKTKAETLRGLKSALLYAKVERNKRESGLTQEEEVVVLAREAKKRAESAELYLKGGANDRAEIELTEKAVIDAYLPQQLSEDELRPVILETIEQTGINDVSRMGVIIAEVKKRTAGSADGATIARLVKEVLSQ